MRTLALALCAACGAAPKPPPAEATSEAATIDCAPYLMKRQQVVASGPHGEDHPAFGAALADGEAGAAASEAGDHRAAARHFLDCARRYREVEAGHAQRPAATYNAEVCYYDALHAFANAGRLEAEGRAALEQAVADDPPMAAYLRRLLDDPPADCAAGAAPAPPGDSLALARTWLTGFLRRDAAAIAPLTAFPLGNYGIPCKVSSSADAGVFATLVECGSGWLAPHLPEDALATLGPAPASGPGAVAAGFVAPAGGEVLVTEHAGPDARYAIAVAIDGGKITAIGWFGEGYAD